MKKLFVLIKGTPAIARPKRIWSNKCISINQSINSVVPNPRSVGHLVPDTIFEYNYYYYYYYFFLIHAKCMHT